jgi:ABC-type polysaccharide/polyol phosphate transport system ATPase subunit
MAELGDVERGAVHARSLGRRFILRSADTRSLKEVILHRRLPQKHELWALRAVDLDIAPGESVGLVGANGSGKSTLLKLVAGIFRPSEGKLAVGGRVGSLLELGAGFHPDFSGVENAYLNGALYGLKRAYIDKHLDEIIAFAELEDFAHAPVKTYSSGMYARLGFSVAVHIQPDVLLLDEVLAVGDEAFQQKCHAKIWEFKRAGGTIVFVSHDSTAVERLCERSLLLDKGRVGAEGATTEVLAEYHRRLEAAEESPAPSPAGVG